MSVDRVTGPLDHYSNGAAGRKKDDFDLNSDLGRTQAGGEFVMERDAMLYGERAGRIDNNVLRDYARDGHLSAKAELNRRHIEEGMQNFTEWSTPSRSRTITETLETLTGLRKSIEEHEKYKPTERYRQFLAEVDRKIEEITPQRETGPGKEIASFPPEELSREGLTTTTGEHLIKRAEHEIAFLQTLVQDPQEVEKMEKIELTLRGPDGKYKNVEKDVKTLVEERIISLEKAKEELVPHKDKAFLVKQGRDIHSELSSKEIRTKLNDYTLEQGTVVLTGREISMEISSELNRYRRIKGIGRDLTSGELRFKNGLETAKNALVSVQEAKFVVPKKDIYQVLDDPTFQRQVIIEHSIKKGIPAPSETINRVQQFKEIARENFKQLTKGMER